MKKKISVLIFVTLIFSCFNLAAAEASTVTSSADVFAHQADNVYGEYVEDPDMAALSRQKDELSTAYYNAKIAGKNDAAEKALRELYYFNTSNGSISAAQRNLYSSASINLAATRAVNNSISITQFPQLATNWCGPAAVRSILYHKGKDYSQSTLAGSYSYPGTYLKTNYYGNTPWYTTNGNSVSYFPVATTLNDIWIGITYIPSPMGPAGTNPMSYNTLASRVVSTIDSGYSMALCGTSYGTGDSHLPNYPGYEIGHWLALKGYWSYGDLITLVDPAKSSYINWSGPISAYPDVSKVTMAAFISPRGIIY